MKVIIRYLDNSIKTIDKVESISYGEYACNFVKIKTCVLDDGSWRRYRINKKLIKSICEII